MAVLHIIGRGQKLPDGFVTSLRAVSILNNDVPSKQGDLVVTVDMSFRPATETSLSSLGFQARAGNRIALELYPGAPWVWSHPLTSLSQNRGKYYLATEAVVYEVSY